MSTIPFERSFASHPKAQYWSEKNVDENGNKIKPENVSKGSNKKYWFNCIECKHQFEGIIKTITNSSWCSFCVNKQLCNDDNCKICLEKSFASNPKAKYWSDKNKDKEGNVITSRDVFKSSGKKYIFKFECCGHEYISEPDKVIRNKSNCPYCIIPSKLLCNDNNCQICFERSFASHEKAKYWSEKNKDDNKNIIRPRDIFKVSGKKYLFNCECGHEIEKIIADITHNGSWCSYCCEPVQKLCNDNDCLHCFEKSFASHPKSHYWSKKNELKPRNVTKSTNKRYIFNCFECKHEFDMDLSHISLNQGWCSYCASKKLCSEKDCQICFNKSFESHPKSQYWSEKNIDENGYKLTPRDIFETSGKEYIFVCKYKHEFKSIIANIKKGQWCPKCKNKTEQKLFEALKVDYPDLKHQFREEWCKNPITNKHLPFDFVLEKEKIIIELDGRQHFTQVSNWSTPEEQYERDTYKMECANQNGYSVIRITQEDVYDDTFDWYKMLKESIETIIQKESVENHYISYEDDYIHFN